MQNKNSKRELKNTHDELKLTQQLIQQERLQAMGRLARSLAHDFNNFLSPILGYTDILLKFPQIFDDKKKVLEYLQIINDTAKDATNTIKRLRKFYREREEGDMFLPIELSQLVNQAIELTQPKWRDQAQSDGITINIETDLEEISGINGNESELREVLANLIINSVDAMPENGTITISTHVDGEYAVLEVNDTGIGMNEEIRQKCFEPFFSTKEEDGAGLGLSIVYGIVQRHKGTIEIESEEGKGTKIIIRLPLTTSKQNEEEVNEEERPLPLLHVLVVDDEPNVCKVVSAYLAMYGHTSETASNGREGLEKIRAGKFDLVITDRAMPDITGAQLADAAKQISPNIPVIMMTGYPIESSGEKPSSVDLIMNKPIMLNDFKEALIKVIME